jgi:hypothetical protein
MNSSVSHWHSTATIPQHSRHTRFSAMATAIVLCDLRTDYTRPTETYLIISRAVAHVFGRLPLTGFDPRPANVRFAVDKIILEQGVSYHPPSPCTSVLRSQYLFINAPCPPTPSFYYQTDKWAKRGNLLTKPCGFEYRGSDGQIEVLSRFSRGVNAIFALPGIYAA